MHRRSWPPGCATVVLPGDDGHRGQGSGDRRRCRRHVADVGVLPPPPARRGGGPDGHRVRDEPRRPGLAGGLAGSFEGAPGRLGRARCPGSAPCCRTNRCASSTTGVRTAQTSNWFEQTGVAQEVDGRPRGGARPRTGRGRVARRRRRPALRAAWWPCRTAGRPLLLRGRPVGRLPRPHDVGQLLRACAWITPC